MNTYAIPHEKRISLYARRYERGLDIYTGHPAETLTRSCVHCGGDFPESESGRKLYCSKRCSDSASKLRTKKRRARGEPTGNCDRTAVTTRQDV